MGGIFREGNKFISRRYQSLSNVLEIYCNNYVLLRFSNFENIIAVVYSTKWEVSLEKRSKLELIYIKTT